MIFVGILLPNTSGCRRMQKNHGKKFCCWINSIPSVDSCSNSKKHFASRFRAARCSNINLSGGPRSVMGVTELKL
jgi:hypothetical protein